MIRRAALLGRSIRGSAAIQFAFAAPVLILFIIGTAQIGTLYAAYTGMQQALGEGARLATLYPRPSDTAIGTRVRQAKFSLDSRYLSSSLSHGTANGVPYVDIQLTYAPRLNFIFFAGPSISITRTRRAYLY